MTPLLKQGIIISIQKINYVRNGMVLMQNLRKSRLRLALVLVVAIALTGMTNRTESKQGTKEPEKTVNTQTTSLKIEPKEKAAPQQLEEPVVLFYIPEIPLGKELQEYTYDLCVENDVDYELVLAVMWRESRFKLDATGYNDNGTQDSGVMQINDCNKEWIADELNVTDLYDPRQNILAGVTMLSDLIGTYGEHDGLTAYGAGEAGMLGLKSKGIKTLDNVQIALDKRDEIEAMKKILSNSP